MKLAKLAEVMLTVVLASGGLTVGAVATGASPPHSTGTPTPPRLPANFNWVGRYIVDDMHVNVPFTWQGSDGDSQMTAGGPNDPIWFTNVIYHGHLYTLTKRWKGIPENVLNVCHDAGAYSLTDYNNWLKTSSFVGPEVLEGQPSRAVNHFRAVIVVEPFAAKGAQEGVLPPIGATPNQVPPTSGPSSPTATTVPGLPLRFPVMEADFYVARTDPRKIVKVLHFGWQNYYDPNMDEWLTVQRFSSKAGKVVLPGECTEAAPPSPSAAGSSSP